MALKAFHLKIEKIQFSCFGACKSKRLETNLVYVAYKYTTNAKEITKIAGKVKYSKEKFLALKLPYSYFKIFVALFNP